jgi:galactan 5-O-arabinofuranosyltransferase
MWRNDSGANVGPVWPPLGELGNVGLFSVLLVAGLALALVLGWRRTPVVVACTTIAGAWVLRLYLAGKMFETNSVKLYPRTTQLILYLLLILVGYATYYATQRVSDLYHRLAATDRSPVPFALLLAPLLMLFMFIGSATVDRLMPADKPGTDADATWISHATNLPNGRCPTYGRGVACVER